MAVGIVHEWESEQGRRRAFRLPLLKVGLTEDEVPAYTQFVGELFDGRFPACQLAGRGCSRLHPLPPELHLCESLDPDIGLARQ